MPLGAQLIGQRPQRFRGPTQWCHRITAGVGVDQLVQRRSQFGIVFLGAFTPATATARAAHRQRCRIVEFRASSPDRVPRHPHRVGDQRHSTRAQLAGLATQPHPTLTLGQMRFDHLVATRHRLHDTGHSTDGRSHGAQNYVISLRVLRLRQRPGDHLEQCRQRGRAQPATQLTQRLL
jgi:hypothetical protein